MDLMTTLAPRYGMQVVAEIVSQGAAESVPAEVSQVRTAQTDVVLFAIYAEDAIRFMQEFKRQDYAPPLLWADDAGFISPDFQQTLGADAAYVTSREIWSLDITQTNSPAAQINTLFRIRYGKDLNGNSARGFIGMMTLTEAINRAGTTDSAAVRDALKTTDIPAEQLIVPWRGIRFDNMGQNTLGDGIVVQMINTGTLRSGLPISLLNRWFSRFLNGVYGRDHHVSSRIGLPCRLYLRGRPIVRLHIR
jgi:branched-chain amino acid transport system substrate-binding protein